jgi:putative ABC transport system permease protein
MEGLIQDIRYAARTLWKQPVFALIAVLTLAVGIGANTAIYSVVDATILRALPFRDPGRLMKVSITTPSMRGRPPRDDSVWSYPKYQTFLQVQKVFESAAIYRTATFNISGDAEPERIRAEIVSESYFPTLGVNALVGRNFLPEEDATPETRFVTILGNGLWLRRFGGDPKIVGKTVTLDTKPYTVVGVLPAGFRALSGLAEIWVPVHTLNARNLTGRWNHSYELIARLKPGVAYGQAKAAVTVAGVQVDQAHQDAVFHDWGAKARTMDEARVEPAIRKSVLVLFGAVGCVLLIACVNIANLLLARATSREREIAVRLAVGAGRGRLVRQLLTESVLLAMLSAVASVAIAWLGVRLLSVINPATGSVFGRRFSGLTVLGLGSIHLDSRALLFTCSIALATGVLFGLLPALQASRPSLTDALKTGGSKASGLGSGRILTGKSLLITSEIALALMLLIGAGLMIKSFARLMATRIGVDVDNVLTLRVNLPAIPETGDTSVAFFTELQRRIQALPGVVDAGMHYCFPLAGGCNATGIEFKDRPPVGRGSQPIVGIQWASPEYFKTMRVPLIKGRLFTSADRLGAPRVVLINETAARRFWPSEDPIGKPIAVGQGEGFDDRAEVIGIVADVRYGQMDEPPSPDVYINYMQSPYGSLMLFVRTAGNPTALTDAVRREVHSLNRNLPVFDVLTMRERIRDATSKARFSATLLMTFAAIALILAAVGIYGVMSYAVTQRTREIGIRVALGARPGEVRALVLRRAVVLTAAGIGLGLAGAAGVTRVLSTLLYEVKPSDPSTYALVAGLLGLVSLSASYIPAVRATRVDPLTALRAE